jgi:hypothetical protein
MNMNEDVANRRSHLVSIDEVIAQIFTEIDKIADQLLKTRFNTAVANLMGYIARDLIFPLENIYPDLREGN